jgi:NADPH:quinone reductase-like Zn-dependent oxidoreductase
LVFKIPKEMTFREAAVLPISYITAYILLFEIGNIKPNQTLLFHSAGGGVGGKIIIETLKIAIKKIFFS